MKLKEKILKEWENLGRKNQLLFRDVFALAFASILFHFLYWGSDMNSWIFGPFTDQVYGFFQRLAFDNSKGMVKSLVKVPMEIDDTGCNFFFYTITDNGMKVYTHWMSIIHDCSGLKQLFQWLLIIILCRGKWYKKFLPLIVGFVVLLCANIIRIITLTTLYSEHPESFQFVHDWITRPMMYVIIFSMWIIYLNIFAKDKKVKDPKKKQKA